MTKHGMFQSNFPPKPSKLPMHPVWRGIGLIMMVVLPVGSYLLASMLIENRNTLSWVIIPTDIILNKYPKDPLILVRILYAVIILILIAVILAFFTFVAARLFGPSRLDPFDMPSDKVKKS
jgi:hypothetical protein